MIKKKSLFNKKKETSISDKQEKEESKNLSLAYGTDMNPDYTHYYGSKIGSKISGLRRRVDSLMSKKGSKSEIIKIEREISRLINLAES